MTIEFTKTFDKQFDKLRRNEQKRVIESIELFKVNPFAPQLRNHKLEGIYSKYRSISAGGDIRLHYLKKDDKITIVFVEIGTHSQLY